MKYALRWTLHSHPAEVRDAETGLPVTPPVNTTWMSRFELSAAKGYYGKLDLEALRIGQEDPCAGCGIGLAFNLATLGQAPSMAKCLSAPDAHDCDASIAGDQTPAPAVSARASRFIRW